VDEVAVDFVVVPVFFTDAAVVFFTVVPDFFTVVAPGSVFLHPKANNEIIRTINSTAHTLYIRFMKTSSFQDQQESSFAVTLLLCVSPIG
jgi:hypothetical protein